MSPRWLRSIALAFTMSAPLFARAQAPVAPTPDDPYDTAPSTPTQPPPPAATTAAPAPTATGSGDSPAPPPQPAPEPSPAPTPPPEPPGPAPSTAAPAAPANDTNLHTVRIVHDDKGFKLQLAGKDALLRGMNWGYSPVGTNYSYDLWSKPDAFIERVLTRDMGLLRDMGVNAIRLFSDVPPRWITWIHDHYGIYTSLNHLMGRYGFTVDGAYVAQIDYHDPKHRQAILADLAGKVEQYKNTRGLLFWLLGNENNYGLAWTSFEIEALPGQEDDVRAEFLYSLMGEAIAQIKARDTNHPVALVNGDIQYLPLIAKHCKGLDALGANVYRGASAGDLFDKVKATLNLPVFFTEFGADAFDARAGREDHLAQADYLKQQWEEIYLQSYGHGQAGNALGGFIFQWDDGWWKVGQETNLDIHDTKATWPNAGYPKDYVPGDNNMNEEWFGIASKEKPDSTGFYEVHPRAAYYLLREAFLLDPYAADTTPTKIRAHFDALNPRDFGYRYDAEEALARTAALASVRLSNLSMRFDTYASRGSARTERADRLVFDHTESFFVDVAVQPTPRASGRVSFNILGNVAGNRLDRIFYETRGVVDPVPGTETKLTPAEAAEALERDRLAVYRAEFSIDQPDYTIDGYYRTGHYHWGDEGDFFGLYPEANYGPNLDRYNGEAPFGVVVAGKGSVEGIKVAFGPQLYWGANPAVIAKYRLSLGTLTLTAMHQEDIAAGSNITTSSAVPEPAARKSTLHLQTNLGKLQLGLGGIFSSPQKVGEPFIWTRETAVGYLGSGYDVLNDKVRWADTFGGKAKLVYDDGAFRFYAQGAARGLVANGGPDSTITLTRWSLKESGRGNQVNGLGGLTVQFGDVQLGPNFLYQKPLIGPLPNIADRVDGPNRVYYKGIKPRNFLDDPFAVLDNRETIAGELLVVYDPTPGSWYGSWDREAREDAGFAGSVDFVYRHQPTPRDSNVGFLADGTPFGFGASPPAHDTWDLTGTWVANPAPLWNLSGSLFFGQGQSRGEDARLFTHYGGSLRLLHDTALFTTSLTFDDWGPYDYHRDFNLTYPIQWYADASLGLHKPVLDQLGTRFGLRWQLRSLDEHSEGYLLDASDPSALGWEYEIGTYILMSL